MATKSAAAKKSGGRTTPKGGPPTNLNRPDAKDRLRSKKGLVRRIPVYLDSEVLEEYEQAKAEADLLSNPTVKARTGAEAQAAAHDRLAAAKDALDESTVMLVLGAPVVTYTDEDAGGVERTLRGRPAYEYLIETNPATDEQNAASREAHGEDSPYNPDTFAPAIIAACLKDPVMTADEVDEMIEEWTLAEAMTLFNAAMEICNASQVGTLGKGFGGILGS